jgi:hypothetical protein
MADYSFKVRLQAAPVARMDGSTCVAHDIKVISRPVGGGTWALVPRREQIVYIPAAEIRTIMDMPHDEGAQRTAKSAAYKNALVSNMNTGPVAITGWGMAQLESLMDTNDLAAYEAGRVGNYITETLGKSYPFDFSI